MTTCFNILFLLLFLFILITPVIQELEKNWVSSCVAQEPFRKVMSYISGLCHCLPKRFGLSQSMTSLGSAETTRNLYIGHNR
jgi:hypothetical protein